MAKNGTVMIARCYLSMSTHRGGEVRSPGRVLHMGAAITKSIHPESWLWKDVLTTVWKLEGEHINILESRAFGLMLRGRLRRHFNLGSRFSHLVDSLVTLSAMAKGRSSSVRLSRVVARCNALMLAGHLYPTLGYVRSHLNPSDAGSRKVTKQQLKQHS